MEDKKNSFGHIVKLIFKCAFWTFIISVNVLVFWRVFSSGDTKTSKKFIWDDNSLTVYNQCQSDFDLTYQTSDTNIDEDGLFALSNTFTSKAAGTLQCTVRFNNSTVKKLMSMYNLEQKPTGEIFTFILTDNLGNTYNDYTYIAEKKNVYNYRKLIFNNIDFSNIITNDDLINLNIETVDDEGNVTTTVNSEIINSKLCYFTLKIYYIEDVTLDEPLSSLSAFSYERKTEALNANSFITSKTKADTRLKKRSVYITND